MRDDVFIKDVLARCDALKSSGLWPVEPKVRPRAWLNNFDPDDRWLAAMLLDRFTFYNDALTDRLLLSAFSSLADGLPKGPTAPGRAELVAALDDAVFTPVEGEDPNRTDSGNFLCRKARQLLLLPDSRVVEPRIALQAARAGRAVVFLDDFIGSGDQFMSTWTRDDLSTGALNSFANAHSAQPFPAMYVCLVATSGGLTRIAAAAPNVAVSVAHVLDASSSVFQIVPLPPRNTHELQVLIESFLKKYESRLAPREPYIANNADFRLYGYRKLGLMFAFAHSVPDATLPIFWSAGTGNWTPLVERT